MIRPACYNIPEGKSEQEALPDELLELLANIFQGVTNAFGDNATLYRLDIGRVYESVQTGDLVVAGQFVDRSDGEVFNFEINQGTNKVGYKSTGDFLDRNALSVFLGEEAGGGDADDDIAGPSESGPYPFDLLVQAIRDESSEAYQSPFASKLRKDLDYLGALSALMYHAGATIEAQPLYTGLHSYAIKYALRGLRLFSQSISSIQDRESADSWVDKHGLDFAAAVVKEFSSRRCIHFQESIQSEDQEGIQELKDLVEEAIGMAMATTTDLIKSVVEADDYQSGDVQATLAAAIEEYCPIDNSEGYNAVDNARQLSSEWQEVVSRSGCVEDLSMSAIGLPSAQIFPSEQSAAHEQRRENTQDPGQEEEDGVAGERIFYVNVGEGPSRNWDDCRKFGFLAAGGGRKWSKQLEKIQIDDTVIAYLKGYGYVGIGKVTSTATPATKFMVNGVLIKELPLINDTIRSIKRFSKENGEYLIGINWQVAVPREQAAWQANAGLYTTALVCASLGNQVKTIDFATSRLLDSNRFGIASPARPDSMIAATSNANNSADELYSESGVDNSLRHIVEPLSANRALSWLRSALAEAANHEVDTDDVIKNLVDREWESVDEFLDFFTEISVQLARSAAKDINAESAKLFGSPIVYGLSLDSPYFRLWEQAYQTQSSRLSDPISISDWDGEIAAEIEEVTLAMMMPLAAAYEDAVLAALRNRLYPSLTEAQEEFLGYVAASLAQGYHDGNIPLEILFIPSSRILCEILEDWTQYPDLWLPYNLEQFLSSGEFERNANESVKVLITRVLKGQDPSCYPDEWQEFKDENWTEERLSRAIQKIENTETSSNSMQYINGSSHYNPNDYGWEITEAFAFPPGRYFLGDPAHALTEDQYREACEVSYNSSGYVDGVGEIAVFKCPGDGQYVDEDGCTYTVGSGTLGVVPIGHLSSEQSLRLKTYGRILEDDGEEFTAMIDSQGHIFLGAAWIFCGGEHPLKHEFWEFLGKNGLDDIDICNHDFSPSEVKKVVWSNDAYYLGYCDFDQESRCFIICAGSSNPVIETGTSREYQRRCEEIPGYPDQDFEQKWLALDRIPGLESAL